MIAYVYKLLFIHFFLIEHNSIHHEKKFASLKGLLYTRLCNYEPQGMPPTERDQDRANCVVFNKISVHHCPNIYYSRGNIKAMQKAPLFKQQVNPKKCHLCCFDIKNKKITKCQCNIALRPGSVDSLNGESTDAMKKAVMEK